MVKIEILGNLMMKCQNNGKKLKLQRMGGLQSWQFVFQATCSYLDSNMWFPCILFYSFSLSLWHSQIASSCWPHAGMMNFLAGGDVTGLASSSPVYSSASCSPCSPSVTWWDPRAATACSSASLSSSLFATQPPTWPSSSSCCWPLST